jgi:hypothetical protein
MPYVSEKQRKWMHHNRPDISDRWDMIDKLSKEVVASEGNRSQWKERHKQKKVVKSESEFTETSLAELIKDMFNPYYDKPERSARRGRKGTILTGATTYGLPQ